MIAKRAPNSQRTVGESAAARRKRLGAFYTPPDLVGAILDEAMAPILEPMVDAASCRARLARLRIIDPACGSGHFLLGAWRRLADLIERIAAVESRRDCLQLAAASLHGIDIDPQARAAGRPLLEMECERWGMEPGDFAHWCRLGDALLGELIEPGTFGLVVGNPPFVDSESMCAGNLSRRRGLAGRYATARGNWDLASLFVELALRLARPGGRVGLVLPRRLLASDHARHVQALLLKQTIESIRVNRLDAFEEAAVETVSVVMRRGRGGDGQLIRIIDGPSCWSFAQRDLAPLPPGHWSAALAGRGSALSTAINPAALRERPRLRECAFVGDGATTAEAYRLREAIVERRDATDAFVQLINTGTIDPYQSHWGTRPTRYLKTAWIEPVVPLGWLESHMPRRAAQACSAKVLVAGLAGRIEAVVDDGSALCGKSAVQVIPLEPVLCHALCAWLNSTPVNDFYRVLFGSRGFGVRSMHIGPRQLEQLPTWRLNDRAIAEELAELSRALHSREVHSNQSRRLHARIDAIVSELLA
ncbi:MAG: N-6 DNA methylase [Phycisphaerales bacterium]|nr:N-6 DNA methylase [Phycisphaerales bacterium]